MAVPLGVMICHGGTTIVRGGAGMCWDVLGVHVIQDHVWFEHVFRPSPSVLPKDPKVGSYGSLLSLRCKTTR